MTNMCCVLTYMVLLGSSSFNSLFPTRLRLPQSNDENMGFNAERQTTCDSILYQDRCLYWTRT